MRSNVGHYLAEMRKSIASSEDSEALFREVLAVHEDKFGKGILAEQRAASHPQMREAIGNGTYYRSRAQMYALGAIAELLAEEAGPP